MAKPTKTRRTSKLNFYVTIFEQFNYRFFRKFEQFLFDKQFNEFVEEVKTNYKLRPSDKINKTIDNISMFQGFLDVLK